MDVSVSCSGQGKSESSTRPQNLELGVNTFRWHFQLSALHDLHGLSRAICCTFGNVFDLLDNIITLKDLAEDDVFTIEPTETC